MPAVKNPANTPSGKEAAEATSTFWRCVLGFDKWSNYFNERGIIVPQGVILKWGDDPPPTIPPCICSSASSMSVQSCGSGSSNSSSASSESSSEFEESITISIGRPPTDPVPKDATKQRKGSQDVKQQEKSEEKPVANSESKEGLHRQESASKENLKQNERRRKSKDSQLSSQETAEGPHEQEPTSKENVKKKKRKKVKENGPSNQASVEDLNRNKSTSKENVKKDKKKKEKSAEEIQVHRMDQMTNQRFPREALRSESPNYGKMRRASPNVFESDRGNLMHRQEARVNPYNERTGYSQSPTKPTRHPSPSYSAQRSGATPVSSRRRPSPVLPSSQSVEMVVLNLDGTEYTTTQVFSCGGAVVDPPPSRCPNAGPRQVSYQSPPTTSPARGCPNKTQESGNAGEPDQYPMVDPNTGNKYVLIKVASGTRKHPEDISVMMNEPPVGNQLQERPARQKKRRHKKKSDSEEEEEEEEEEDSEVEDVEDDTGARKKHKRRRQKVREKESDSDDDTDQYRTTSSQNPQEANSVPIYITKRRVKKHRGDRNKSRHHDDSADEIDGKHRDAKRHHGDRKRREEDKNLGESEGSPDERERSRGRHDNHNGRSRQQGHHSHPRNERSRSEKTGPCGRCGRRDDKKQSEPSGQGGAAQKRGSGRSCCCRHAACDRELNASSRSEADGGTGSAAEGGADGEAEAGAADSNDDSSNISESENGKNGKGKKGKSKKAKDDTEKNNKKTKKTNSKEKEDKSKGNGSSPPPKVPPSDTHESSDSSGNGGDAGDAASKPAKGAGAKKTAIKTGKKEEGSTSKRDKRGSTGNAKKSESPKPTEDLSTDEKPEKMQKGKAVTIDMSRSSSSSDMEDESDVKPTRSESSGALANQRKASTEKTPKRSREKILKNTRTEASTSTTTLQDRKKSVEIGKAVSTQTDFDEQEKVSFIQERKGSEKTSLKPTISDSSFELVDKRKKKSKKSSKEKMVSVTPFEVAASSTSVPDHSKDKPTGITESTQTDFEDQGILAPSDQVQVGNDDNLENRRLSENPTTSDSSFELNDKETDKKKKKKNKKSSKEKIASGKPTERTASSIGDQPKDGPLGITESTQTDFEDQKYNDSANRSALSDSSYDHEVVELDPTKEKTNSKEQQLGDISNSNVLEEENKAPVDRQSVSHSKADTNEVNNELSEKIHGKNKNVKKSNEKYITTYVSSTSAKFTDSSKLPTRTPGGQGGRKSGSGRRPTNTSLESKSNLIQKTSNVTANATLIITGPANTEQDGCSDEERSFVIRPNVTMTDGTFVLTFKSCACGDKAAATDAPAAKRVTQGIAPVDKKGAGEKKGRSLRSISDLEIEPAPGQPSEPGVKGLQKKSTSGEGGVRKGSKDEGSEIEYLSSAYDKAEVGEESKGEKGRGRQGVPLGGKANKPGVLPTRGEGEQEASQTRMEGQQGPVAALDSRGEMYRQQRRPCAEGGCRRRGGVLFGVGAREKRKKEATVETKDKKDEGEPTDENEDKNAKSREDKKDRKGKTKSGEESKEAIVEPKDKKDEGEPTGENEDKNAKSREDKKDRKGKTKSGEESKEKLEEDKRTEEKEKNQKDDQQNEKKKNKLKGKSDNKRDNAEDEPNDGDEKKEDNDKKETDKEGKKKKTRIEEGSKEKMKDDEDKGEKDDDLEKKAKEKEDKKKKRYRRSSVESGASVRMVTAFNAHLATQALGRQKLAARNEAPSVDQSFHSFWRSSQSAASTEPQGSLPATSTAPQGSLPATSTTPTTSTVPRKNLPATSTTCHNSQPPSTLCHTALLPSTVSFPSSVISLVSNNLYPSSPNMPGKATHKAEPPRLHPIRFQRNPPDANDRGVCDYAPSLGPAISRAGSSHEACRQRILMGSHSSMADAESVPIALAYGASKSSTSSSETHRTDESESSGKKRKRGQGNDHDTSMSGGGVVESLIMAVSTGMTPTLAYNYDTKPQKSYSRIKEILEGEQRRAQNLAGDKFIITKAKDMGHVIADIVKEARERHESSKKIPHQPLENPNNHGITPMVNGADPSNKGKKTATKLLEVEKFERLTKTSPKVYVLLASDEEHIQPLCHPKVMRAESADSVITAQAAGLHEHVLQTQRSASAHVQHGVEGSSAVDSVVSRLSKGCRFSDIDTAPKGNFFLDITESAASALRKDQEGNDVPEKSRHAQDYSVVRRLIRVAQAPQTQPGAASSAESSPWNMGSSQPTVPTGCLKRTHRQSREDIFKVKDAESWTETRASQENVSFPFGLYYNLENSSKFVALQNERDKVGSETQIDSQLKKKESKWSLLSFLGHGLLKSRSKPTLRVQHNSRDNSSVDEDSQSTSAVSADFSNELRPSSTSNSEKQQSSSATAKRKAAR